MKIVIVAAGLATRLRPITNYIPKILVNVGKNTGLVEIVKCWLDPTRHLRATEVTGFKIIIHSKFKQLVDEYWSLYFPNVPMQTVVYDESPGTAKTIHDVTSLPEMSDLNGDEVIFSWCDVYPGDVQFAFRGRNELLLLGSAKFVPARVTAVTADTDNCYDLRDGKFVQCQHGGNVIGIYHFSHDFSPNLIANYEPGDDFVEALNRIHGVKIDSLPLGDRVNDFGDRPKLSSLVARLNDGAREFNSIKFYDDPPLVHKRAINDQGVTLIAREIGWYDQLRANTNTTSETAVPRTPKVFSSPGSAEFYMERLIDARPIHEAFEYMQPIKQLHVVKSCMSEIGNLHASGSKQVSIDQVVVDIEAEVKNKLTSRCNEISGVIGAFGKIDQVNGVYVPPVEDCIEFLNTYIKNHVTQRHTSSGEVLYEYAFIHGDTQFSNCMITDAGEIVIIDPRGYFGKTAYYGLPDYDFSKLLYSLSGYDNFNNSLDFHITNIGDGSVSFELPKPELFFERSELHEAFEPIHYAWLAVHWIGLAQYIKNNPVKSFAALCHGRYLATKFYAYVTRSNETYLMDMV